MTRDYGATKPALISRDQVAWMPPRLSANMDLSWGMPGCWEWRGGHYSLGYGMVTYRTPGGGKNTTGAHRLAYVMLVGDIPANYVIDHLCRNAGCWRPDHLEAVPSRVNTLRGASTAARYAVREFCERGHRLDDPSNWAPRVKERGHRTCRTCSVERSRELSALIREASAALGVSQKNYVETFGRSAKVAEYILTSGRAS